jgi:hypothetical protein
MIAWGIWTFAVVVIALLLVSYELLARWSMRQKPRLLRRPRKRRKL